MVCEFKFSWMERFQTMDLITAWSFPRSSTLILKKFKLKESVKGWSFTQLGSCEQSKIKNKFLGGHCLLNKKVTKVYDNLPPHKSIRVVATVHLLDKWEGETIFAQFDDKIGTADCLYS